MAESSSSFGGILAKTAGLIMSAALVFAFVVGVVFAVPFLASKWREWNGGSEIARSAPRIEAPDVVVLTGTPQPPAPSAPLAEPELALEGGGPEMAPTPREPPRLGEYLRSDAIPVSEEGGRCTMGEVTYGSQDARRCTGQHFRPTGRECRNTPAGRECRPMRQ